MATSPRGRPRSGGPRGRRSSSRTRMPSTPGSRRTGAAGASSATPRGASTTGLSRRWATGVERIGIGRRACRAVGSAAGCVARLTRGRERRRHAGRPCREQRRQHEQQVRVRVVLRRERAEPFVRRVEVRFRQRVDLGVERGGLRLGELVAPVEELVQGERDVRGDARQQAHVRQALTELPLGYGCLRDAQVGGQRLLRDAQTAALARDRTADVDAFDHLFLP